MASPSLHRIFSPHTLDAWAAIFKKDNATARGESRFGVFSLNASALSVKGTLKRQRDGSFSEIAWPKLCSPNSAPQRKHCMTTSDHGKGT